MDMTLNSANIVDYNLKIFAGIYNIINDEKIPIDQMCDRANMALKSAKRDYVNRYSYYDSEMRKMVMEEELILNDMDTALQNQQFKVCYQPIFSVTSGKPIAARKRDAADGVLQKVPAAERGDVIAVGDGLAEADQIRLEAEIAVAARKAQAEAGAHVVDDQQRALLGAEPAHLLPEAVGRQLVVGEVAVHIRLRDHRSDLPFIFLKNLL